MCGILVISTILNIYEEGVKTMITKEQVYEILRNLEDPLLHKSFEQTKAIEEITINEEKEHVSVRIGLGKLGTVEQMKVQATIVKLLKNAGAKTVAVRFSTFSKEKMDELAGEQEQTLLSPGNKTKFIAVASGKGGVGKSTVAVNLAVALQRLGKKVGLIDADIYGFSVPDMMGITTRPVVRGNKVIPVERKGIKVISMGFFVEDNAPVIWRGPMLGKMLNNFFNEVEWGDLDYLLLDLPPGTGDIALDVHTMLPSCKEVIVTTPHPTAAFVAARAGAMAKRTEHEIVGVIENMAYFESKLTGEKEYVFGNGGGKKLSEELETDLLGQIPLEQPDWDEEDFAPSIYAADHRLGKIYLEIAQKLADKIPTE